MEKKINVAELLKDCPRGMELDCAIYDKVNLLDVSDKEDLTYQIRVIRKDGNNIVLTKYGQLINKDFAKCVIFPKGKTTWEGFQRPFKDGDIVTWEDRGSLVAFIYKERKNVALVKHHFALYAGSLGAVTDGEISLVENEIVFATEEEKQKLFDAIKANGYKWNAETKTLEKLIEPKFKVGDRIKSKELKPNINTITQVYENYYELDDRGILPLNYQDKWELVPDKFDINTLKPFDKVLVRDSNKQKWTIDFFSFIDKSQMSPFICSGHYTYQCIPYEKNEHLLGTTNDCDEFYKTW